MKRTILFIFFLSKGMQGAAQQPEESAIDFERVSDDLLGFQEQDADYGDIYENLAQILSSPYDLNQVSAEELRSLNVLSDKQIRSFLDYRSHQSRFLDIHELQIIPEFDLTIISKLSPFVKVSDPIQAINSSLVNRIFSKGHSYFVSRYERTIETKKGFKPIANTARPYGGSPDKMYFRLRSALPGDFSIGITGEKDAGEKISFNHQKHWYGVDFLSYHIQLQNKGLLKNVILGDFQTQFGQGLMLGGAFGLGKGGETVSTARKSNLGFLPYTSVNESAYLRGAAVTIQATKNIQISGFCSHTKRDGATSAGDEETSVPALQSTGYHRTINEIENRKMLTETNYGIVAHYQKSDIDAGAIFNAIHFGLPIKKTSTPYNQWMFDGSENFNTGLFLNYRIANFSFFSEGAKSLTGGWAVLAGWLVTPHPKLDFALTFRRYAQNFYSFYANAFSENTQPQNETGYYWGWKYRWNRKYNLTGYADIFSFPWLGFRRYAPSQGYEWLVRVNYQPLKKVLIFGQFREESKFRNQQGITKVYQLAEGIKRNLSISCDYGLTEKLRLKTRVQHSSYFFNNETSEGLTIIQDIAFSISRFKFTGRHALFDTDDYDNRQYAYENDAWLAYSLPAYSGTGVRNYALIEYSVHKQLTIWLRYSRTRISSATEIGSGQDAIEGNIRNDVKFQARLKF